MFLHFLTDFIYLVVMIGATIWAESRTVTDKFCSLQNGFYIYLSGCICFPRSTSTLSVCEQIELTWLW